MDACHLTAIPWQQPAQWLAIHRRLACRLAVGDAPVQAMRRHALEAAGALQDLAPVMERAARHTCSRCTAVCCRHALVWYDLADLLVLHLTGQRPPAGQPMGTGQTVCRYLAEDGCRLPRNRRPFICTWYRCAALRRQLDEHPTSGLRIEQALGRAKQARSELKKRAQQLVALPSGLSF